MLHIDVTPYGDLRQDGVTVSADRSVAGEPFTIDWNVTNAGPGTTGDGTPGGIVDEWTDRVVLSKDAVFGNADDVTVADVTIAGALASGEAYAGTWTGNLPAGLSGRTACTCSQTTATPSSNTRTPQVNLASSNGTVLIAPETYGDLTTVIEAAPGVAIIAGQIQVDWTVTNTTDAWSATPASVWYDRIVLSGDTTYGNADDRTLATVRHDGALDPGTSYSSQATVTLPSNSFGDKFLFVVSDVNDHVYEFVYETNNVSPSQSLSIVAPDLVTQASLTATETNFGDTIGFDWTVANEGDGAAAASFRDRVWLSTDATLGSDTLLATVDAATIPLEPGQQYQRPDFSVSLPLTGTLARRRLLPHCLDRCFGQSTEE